MIINFDEMNLSQRSFYYRMFSLMYDNAESELERCDDEIKRYKGFYASAIDDFKRGYYEQCIEEENDIKDIVGLVCAHLETVAENNSVSFSRLDFKGLELYFHILSGAWDTIVTKREYYENKVKREYDRLRNTELEEGEKKRINESILMSEEKLDVIEYIGKVLRINIK